MRMAATDSASVRAACPVRLGRIAVSPGCKTKACSARTPKQTEPAARPPVAAQPPTQRGAALDFLYREPPHVVSYAPQPRRRAGSAHGPTAKRRSWQTAEHLAHTRPRGREDLSRARWFSDGPPRRRAARRESRRDDLRREWPRLRLRDARLSLHRQGASPA